MRFLREDLRIASHLVKSFAYDWRKSIKQAAQRLQACIADWRAHEFTGQKCALVAHSAGGLVSRYYIERLGGDQDVEHLFLLGVPNTGALKNFQSMYKGSNLYCVFSPEEVRDMSRSFEEIYELLPRDPSQKLFVDQAGNGIHPFNDRRWATVPNGQSVAILFTNLEVAVGNFTTGPLVATQITSISMPISENDEAKGVKQTVRGNVIVTPGARATLLAHLAGKTVLVNLPEKTDWAGEPIFQQFDSVVPAKSDYRATFFLLVERDSNDPDLRAMLTVEALEIAFS